MSAAAAALADGAPAAGATAAVRGAEATAVEAVEAGVALLERAGVEANAAAALMRKARDVEQRIQRICTDATADAHARDEQ